MFPSGNAAGLPRGRSVAGHSNGNRREVGLSTSTSIRHRSRCAIRRPRFCSHFSWTSVIAADTLITGRSTRSHRAACPPIDSDSPRPL